MKLIVIKDNKRKSYTIDWFGKNLITNNVSFKILGTGIVKQITNDEWDKIEIEKD